MKKLINAAESVVSDSLTGLATAHPGSIRVDLENKVVYRSDGPVPGKVGLVSGGGSGHEPLHSGYVGRGMLDAACCGEVFTSPVPDQVMAATHAVDGGAGVLHIVKNYTGDVMNFDMAAEMGGNVEGTEAGREVVKHGVLLVGITNLPATMPDHASQLYAKNVQNLVDLMTDDEGGLTLDFEDDIIKGACITHEGAIRNERAAGREG